jgi:hypothetical protein
MLSPRVIIDYFEGFGFTGTAGEAGEAGSTLLTRVGRDDGPHIRVDRDGKAEVLVAFDSFAKSDRFPRVADLILAARGNSNPAAPRSAAGDSMYELRPLNGQALGMSRPEPRKMIYGGPGGLSRNCVGAAAGQGALGKTTLFRQLGASLASGVDCLGGAFPVEVKGPVVMVLAEDSRDEIERSIWRIRQECGGLDLSDLHILPKGGDPRLVQRDRGGNLQPTPGFGKLLALVERTEPVLVVIDSLSVTCGESETSNAEAAYIISLLGQLCEPSEAAVVIVTHVSKASLSSKSQAGKKASPAQTLDSALDPVAVRGSSAIVNNSRWTMTATAVPGPLAAKMGAAKPLMAYAVRKTNYGPPLDIAFLENDGGFLRQFNPKVVRNLTAEVLAYLTEHGPIGRRDFVNGKEFRESLDLSRDALRDVVNGMLEDGAIAERRVGRKTVLEVCGGEPAEVCENDAAHM